MSDAVTDTHALIWYLEDSSRLSTAANEVFNKCDKGELLIHIPTICLVEIIYLQEKGRISLGMKTQLDNAFRTENSGLVLADLSAGVADALATIPRNIVPDMPDRIIVATAKHLDLPLISKDYKIASSGIDIIW
ncbi:PilT protein domain protein [Calothrix parasitica NIES-267]|uniref:PilT protein domain protein n=1 Tax=Calothrix parasitica NIES-267 TaxID=1973488 RepID=A0A1Z4LSN5_9CYAN|nr:PilT protein domain protein [Calothrix parasitica NIES-267]